MSVNKIQIIFTDVDGTLLDCSNNKFYIPKENTDIIKELKKKGIKLCITTGRAKRSAQDIARLVGVEDEYVISYNGSVISKGDEILLHITIPSDILKEINKVIKENNFYALHFHNGLPYTHTRVINENTVYYENKTKEYVKPLGDEVYSLNNITKIFFIGKDYEEQAKIIEKLKPINGILALKSNDTYVDVTVKEANKGNAVKYLCDYLKIPTSNAMALGDGFNDLTMLNAVGTPIVMENANEKVKEGKEVTDTVQNAGFAKAIRKHCF